MTVAVAAVALKLSLLWTGIVPEAAQSSPRATDLNGDGVLDIVVGGGISTDDQDVTLANVTALNGIDGKKLWSFKLDDDCFATPEFADLNGDGKKDVIIGGRINNIHALNGPDGKEIWNLQKANPKIKIDTSNFNAVTATRDYDNDGVVDFFAVQGGTNDGKGSAPGTLMLISGKTGHIIKQERSPDGQEIYATPAVILAQKSSSLPRHGSSHLTDHALVGSGGERVPGHLAKILLPELKQQWTLTSEKKGFIGSPSLFRSKKKEVIFAQSFDGKVYAVSPDSGQPLWRFETSGLESYTSPAPGFFRTPHSDTPDVVTFMAQGTWPVYSKGFLFWINGETGKIIEKQDWGVFPSSSPVTADLNGDGFSEVIATTNDQFGRGANTPSRVTIFDGKTRKPLWEHKEKGFTAGTPWLGKLGKGDKWHLVTVAWGRVFCYVIERDSKSAAVAPLWTEFRGPYNNGTVEK